jgi:putative hydrolase of the HAD superfamily
VSGSLEVSGALPLERALFTGLDALLLDAGNTLVFLDHEVVAQHAREAGLDVSADALRVAESSAKRRYEALLAAGGAHEDGWSLYFVALFGALGVDELRARAVVPALRAVHDRLNLWRRVPDGVREALERARDAGVVLGVVSNSEGMLDALFAHVGLSEYFVVVVDSAHEGVRKPDPEIFRRALARIGVAASRAMYVGDLPSVDVDGARAAGMRAVLVDPFAHYPHYADAPRVDSVVEVLDAVVAART